MSIFWDPNGDAPRSPWIRGIRRLLWPTVRRLYWPVGNGASIKIVGPRVERQVETMTGYRVTLVIEDLSLPEAYSREELLEMLTTVRAHEIVMGWKVPEPTLRPVRGSRHPVEILTDPAWRPVRPTRGPA